MTAYAELAAVTNYSFLRGASHPQEMVAAAKALGHAGIGKGNVQIGIEASEKGTLAHRVPSPRTLSSSSRRSQGMCGAPEREQ